MSDNDRPECPGPTSTLPKGQGKVLVFEPQTKAKARGKMRVERNESAIVTRLTLSKERRNDCAHSRLTVSERDRMVTCDTCHAELDPWAVLVEFARDQRDLFWRDKHTEDEHERLRAEANRIAHDIKRQRGQLSRLRGEVRKHGEEPVVPTHGADCRCWQCEPFEVAVTPDALDVLCRLKPDEQARWLSILVLEHKQVALDHADKQTT